MRQMKDSGVEWIGKIPDTWEIQPNKRVMRKAKNICEKYQGESVLSLTMNGVIARDLDNPSGKMPLTFDGYQYISKGNLLMCLFDIDVTPRCVGVINDDGVTSPAYSQFYLLGENLTRYFYYYYLNLDYSKELLHLAKNLRHSLTESQLGEVYVPVPPIEDQRNIVIFLDKKCAQIDALIARQQEAIEKLKAYKLSVITDAVAPKKEWAKGHLGYLATFKNGLNYNGVSTDAEIKFLGVGDFQHHFRLDNADMFSTLKFNGEMPEDLLLQNGDIVFVRSNGSKELVGRSVLIDNVDYPLTYSGFCIRMRNLRQDIAMNEFLLYCFWSHDFRQNLNRDSRGSNINNLNQELLSKLEVALPSLKIQREIVQYLDQKCVSIENAIRKKRRIVEKLHEYKKSLIYEVVTGKREV